MLGTSLISSNFLSLAKIKKKTIVSSSYSSSENLILRILWENKIMGVVLTFLKWASWKGRLEQYGINRETAQ